MKAFLYLACSVFFIVVAGEARAQQEIKVGLAGSEPFVIDTGNDTEGLVVDIWEGLASHGKLGFEYIHYDSVEKALAGLDTGAVDVAAGPISVTQEREEQYDFTRPFYQAGLGILSKNDEFSLWSRVKPFFSKSFFIALTVFLIILAVVGTLIWIVERRTDNEPFCNGPTKGVGNGIWLALVTMTTVGYGDLAPKTTIGRVVLGCWMVVTLISATSLLAGLAGTITQSARGGVRVKNLTQMPGSRVAVVKNSPGEDFTKQNNGRSFYVKTLEEGFEKLSAGEVDAFVFDYPQLSYHLENPIEGHAYTDLYLAEKTYQEQGYAFALRQEDTRIEMLNQNLLSIKEAGVIDDLVKEWLPSLAR
ncbi:MAG: polar amino acid transport system substrate-binding protein [Rubritalea sp.]|jgi:polar amino acid transport system substrate-binding protein